MIDVSDPGYAIVLITTSFFGSIGLISAIYSYSLYKRPITLVLLFLNLPFVISIFGLIIIFLVFALG